jgi:hypothetical protein
MENAIVSSNDSTTSVYTSLPMFNDSEIFASEPQFMWPSTEIAEMLGIRHDNFMRLVDNFLESLGEKGMQSPRGEEISYVDGRNRTQRAYVLSEMSAISAVISSDSPAKKEVLDMLEKRLYNQKLALRNIQSRNQSLVANMIVTENYRKKNKILIGEYAEPVIGIILKRCERVIKTRTSSFETAKSRYSEEDNGSYDDFNSLKNMRSDAVAISIAIKTIVELVAPYVGRKGGLEFDFSKYSQTHVFDWVAKASAADSLLLRHSKFPEKAWAASFSKNLVDRWEGARRKFVSQVTRYDTFCEWRHIDQLLADRFTKELEASPVLRTGLTLAQVKG